MEPGLELKHGALYTLVKVVTTILKAIVIGLLILFIAHLITHNIDTNGTDKEASADGEGDA